MFSLTNLFLKFKERIDLKPGWRTSRGPHLKPRVSASPDKLPSCLSASPKVPQWVRTPISGLGPTPETPVGGRPDKRPAAWEHRQTAPGWARNWISGWLPLAQIHSRGLATNQSPKRRSATQPHQRPGCLQATTAKKSTGSENSYVAPAHRTLQGLLAL